MESSANELSNDAGSLAAPGNVVMTAVDPIFAALTSPGTRFEIVERDGMRKFANAPCHLNEVIESARQFGSATYLVEGKRRLTFDETFALRDALAGVLEINAGDRVVICMRNRIEWMIAFLAVIRRGGIAVLANSRAAPLDLLAQVQDCAPSLVIADKERAAALVSVGYKGQILHADDFPASGHCTAPLPTADPEAPATILFTSGTTGRAKGAILTHSNLITALMVFQLSGLMILENVAREHGIPASKLIENAPQNAALQVCPLFHISGLGANFLLPMLMGGKVVILPRWDAGEALKLIEQENITSFSGVPTMLWDILQHPALPSTDTSSLTQIGAGGQALPLSLLEAVRQTIPQAFIGTGYGLTETTGTISMAVGTDFLRKRESGGRVMPLADVRVEDSNGRILPRGSVGEIVARSPTVMKGYWNRPEETAQVLSSDGWFKTGDIGRVDEEGYVFIIDRSKDMVISGGENIYCVEVEQVISQMPQIQECAIFGIPDERLGERVVAVVYAQGLTEQDVQNHVATTLAAYKAPTQVKFSETGLPRNAVGKIDKIRLREIWNTGSAC